MSEIEVSGEMLDVGEDAVLGEVGGADLGGCFDPREFAATVYRAMERVRRDQLMAAENARPTLMGQMIADSPELQAAQQRASEAVSKHVRFSQIVSFDEYETKIFTMDVLRGPYEVIVHRKAR